MKTVIEMAGQAFETPGTEPAFRNGFWTVTQEELERFAELVRADERARMAEQPAQQEPVAWRDHVEQRLLIWRQSFVNKSGDRLALDDFMDTQSLDDLIDFVCDEYAFPQSQMQRKPLSPQSPCEMTPAERKMFRLGWLECEAAHGIKGDA